MIANFATINTDAAKFAYNMLLDVISKNFKLSYEDDDEDDVTEQ